MSTKSFIIDVNRDLKRVEVQFTHVRDSMPPGIRGTVTAVSMSADEARELQSKVGYVLMELEAEG